MNWESNTTEVIINPKMPEREKITSSLLSTGLKGHIWLSTSGSTTEKWVALSKSSILLSSDAVNNHLGINKNDIWANPLPDFHTGGLGIWARCSLVGAKVANYKSMYSWDPISFLRYIKQVKASVTSLVPTQLYDLVERNCKAPRSLRIVLIGGGRLNSSLHKKALALGWKCYPTYGCTECASQIATAICEINPEMLLLPHVEVKIDEKGFISIKSGALLTTYASIQNGEVILHDPKREGWFETEDMGYLEGKSLHIEGRKGDFIKIGGESVAMSFLQDEIEKLQLEFDLTDDLALVAIEDDRLAYNIHLAATRHSLRLLALVEEYHKRVLPFERIHCIHVVNSIPRNDLNKIKWRELQQIVRDSVSHQP